MSSALTHAPHILISYLVCCFVRFSARLPFQILSSEVETSAQPLKNKNKRKLESADDIQVLKVIRSDETSRLSDAKENVSGDSTASQTSTKDSENVESPSISEGSKLKVTCKKYSPEDSENPPVLGNCKSKATLNECTAKDSENVQFLSISEDTKPKVTSKKYSTEDSENVESSNSEVCDTTTTLNDCTDKHSDKCDAVISDGEAVENSGDVISKDGNEDRDETPCIDFSASEESDSENLPGTELCTPPQKSLSNEAEPRSEGKASILDQHTPKRENRASLSNVASARKSKKLTPKQVQKQLESAKKKEEKERLRQVIVLLIMQEIICILTVYYEVCSKNKVNFYFSRKNIYLFINIYILPFKVIPPQK